MPRDLLDLAAHWCILRTAGPRTLRLVESLMTADVEAWTPRCTIRRPVPGAKPNQSGARPMQDLDAPILPTFVFVSAPFLSAVEAFEAEQVNPHIASAHPPFSILRHRGAVPLIGDYQMAGLQDAEREEAATRRAMLEAESAEAAKAIRNAAIKSEQARQRAEKQLERERRTRLSGERRHVGPGVTVEVEEHAAFAGMRGVVESNDGKTAMIDFGGKRSMKIDAWRLAPVASHESPAPRGLAA